MSFISWLSLLVYLKNEISDIYLNKGGAILGIALLVMGKIFFNGGFLSNLIKLDHLIIGIN